MELLVFTILFSTALGQLADLGMKPDVTFGDHNDRFDLTSLMQDQKVYLDRSGEYRRHGGRKRSLISESDETQSDTRRTIKNGQDLPFLVRRYDDDHESGGDHGTVSDFEENLQKFKENNARRLQPLVAHLHGKIRNGGRRANPEVLSEGPDLEKEILMHHAVPINMTIDGFLQIPSIT